MVENFTSVEFIELPKAQYEHCKATVGVLGEEIEAFDVIFNVKRGENKDAYFPAFRLISV